MNTQKTVLTYMMIGLIVIGLVAFTIPQAKAQFTISTAWEHPDEYGQGIAGFFFQENSSGEWWTITAGGMILPTNDSIFEVESGISIGLDVRVTLNYTYFGLSHPDDFLLGLNYFRLSVIVTTPLETVFSQSNFTYDDLGGQSEEGIWWYSQEVFFTGFLTVTGELYTANVCYEIYW